MSIDQYGQQKLVNLSIKIDNLKLTSVRQMEAKAWVVEW